MQRALEAEQAAAAERRRQKEQERIEAATREADQLEQQHGQTNGQGGEVAQSESIRTARCNMSESIRSNRIVNFRGLRPLEENSIMV